VRHDRLRARRTADRAHSVPRCGRTGASRIAGLSMDTVPLPFRLPLIAILRGIAPHEVAAHADALLDEGFDAIEVPLNSPGWQQSLAAAQAHCGPRAAVGAGTVLREADVDALQALGIRLVVTPNTRPAVIRRAVAAGMYVVAGFATPGEAFDAIDAGAQALKLFPASTYGPGHVRALRAVLPAIPVFAVGGISPGSLPGFLSASCAGAGLGGDLYAAGQPAAHTRERARAFRQAFEGAMP
jgi:2-dehydro-3-deoxyphosphogalactonate aldolase